MKTFLSITFALFAACGAAVADSVETGDSGQPYWSVDMQTADIPSDGITIIDNPHDKLDIQIPDTIGTQVRWTTVADQFDVDALKARVTKLENIEPLTLSQSKLNMRLAELERIVHGLQKQVTILHAKKANE